ncbi:hypothetical protein [Burkholderia ubonensis]|uniref:hypothetical protein n=1 Tax=Burkholderia ubonensis TaxID=101571 RepID=UPI0012F7566E|nr:hypothetical protein [Burkholderia ubonensis]
MNCTSKVGSLANVAGAVQLFPVPLLVLGAPQAEAIQRLMDASQLVFMAQRGGAIVSVIPPLTLMMPLQAMRKSGWLRSRTLGGRWQLKKAALIACMCQLITYLNAQIQAAQLYIQHGYSGRSRRSVRSE